MKCPACKEPSLVISERKGIEIDYCPDCRGIWLDRGELDKILERAREEEGSRSQPSAPAPTPAPQPMHQPHYHPQQDQHHHYKYKRKKSFLEELFD